MRINARLLHRPSDRRSLPAKEPPMDQIIAADSLAPAAPAKADTPQMPRDLSGQG